MLTTLAAADGVSSLKTGLPILKRYNVGTQGWIEVELEERKIELRYWRPANYHNLLDRIEGANEIASILNNK